MATFERRSAGGMVTAVVVGLLAGMLGCEQMGGKKQDRSDRPAASDKPAAPAAGEKSLYERLGGEPAIRAVVDDFVARGAANPKVNFTRKGMPNEWEATPENVRLLKQRLVEFIGSATGGPQKYSGRDMVTAHTGMKITNAEFDALAADLKASLDKLKVPAKEQGELMAVVGGTRGAIVGK